MERIWHKKISNVVSSSYIAKCPLLSRLPMIRLLYLKEVGGNGEEEKWSERPKVSKYPNFEAIWRENLRGTQEDFAPTFVVTHKQFYIIYHHWESFRSITQTLVTKNIVTPFIYYLEILYWKVLPHPLCPPNIATFDNYLFR